MKTVHELKNKIEKKKIQLKYIDAKRVVLRNKHAKISNDIEWLKAEIEKMNSQSVSYTKKVTKQDPQNFLPGKLPDLRELLFSSQHHCD